jgi:hypothetical protein
VPQTRYRCRSCGNLTRFDVVATRRTSSFHHYTVGGELTVEDEQVLDEVVESVTCRWCGTAGAVEPVLESTDSPDGDVALGGAVVGDGSGVSS